MAEFRGYDLFVIGGGSGGVRAARISGAIPAPEGGRSPKNTGSAAPALSAAACRRSSMSTPRARSASISRMPRAMAGQVGAKLRLARSWWPPRKSRDHPAGGRSMRQHSRCGGAAEILHDCAPRLSIRTYGARWPDGRPVRARSTYPDRHRRHAVCAGIPRLSEHAVTSNEIFDLPGRPRRNASLVTGRRLHRLRVRRDPERARCAGDGAGLSRRAADPAKHSTTTSRTSRPPRRMIRHKGVDLRLHADIEADREDRRAGFMGHLSRTAPAVRGGYRCSPPPGGSRTPPGLGLEEAGVRLRKPTGPMAVDEYSQTACALDICGGRCDGAAGAHARSRSARVHAFADTVFGAKPTKADHALVATAIFTQPEIGTVGLSEQAARAEGHELRDLPRDASAPMVHTLSGREERMLMKLLVEKPAARKVLGVHILRARRRRDDPACRRSP